jgi:MarR family transcriptional regulator, transcriptional regulator for hemolysin
MERLGRQIFVVARSLKGRFEQRLGGAGGSVAQWGVLWHLRESPGLSQRELAEGLGVGGSTMTHHLDRFEEDGLIRRSRDDHDRRVVRVSLTTKGRRHLVRLERAADAGDEELGTMLSERDLASLHRILGRLQDRLDARAEEFAGGR